LHQLDPDLVAVLGAVDKQVTRNTVTDGGGQDLFSDKVFLLSRVEVMEGPRERLAAKPPILTTRVWRQAPQQPLWMAESNT